VFQILSGTPWNTIWNGLEHFGTHLELTRPDFS